MTALALQRPAAIRIARAVVSAEVLRLRDDDTRRTATGNWPEDMPIGDEGLGLDSIEQLGALGALAEMFDLDDSLLSAEPPQRVGDWIDWIMAGHAAPDMQMTVRTSGSTGTPHPCVHAVADLLAEAASFAAQLQDRRRVVAMVPAHHLYGLVWTALLPDMLGIPVVEHAIGTPLALAAGDLIVAVPDQWQVLSRLMRRFPVDVVGVSSGGPLDGIAAARLLGIGIPRLIDVYGSSETGAIARRDVPATSYDLMPRWQLASNGDHDVRLVDRCGRHVDLPDRVERTGDRTLRPVARRDGAVQVGGHNVFPDRVVRLLRETDGVADVAVRLNANGRLKAFVVPDGSRPTTELAAILERTAARTLTDPECPRSFCFGPALPRNAMGKLEDWI